MSVQFSPRQRFVRDVARTQRHVDLVRSEPVQDSIQAALAQMVMQQQSGENIAKSWDSHNRIEGAKEFIKIWLNLAEPETKIDRPKDTGNLLSETAPKPMRKHD